MNKIITQEQIWQLLDEIPDPEIPVVSMVDLGIIQAVEMAEDGAVLVKMTPTFAGCPALSLMREEIEAKLHGAGVETVKVEVILDPPWTSDRINDEARARMAEFGIAPPMKLNGRGDGAMIMLFETVECPFCHSKKTHMENVFGPTLCRAIYYCDECKQAFELFKPL